MKHWGLKLYKVHINDDPGLTLTYFICFCTSSRPRYQVSVYRTIGPLVLHAIIHFHVKECNISQKNQKEKKNFTLNPLDEAKDYCRAYCVKPLGHVVDLPFWTYA